MKLSNLVEQLGLKQLTKPAEDREISNVYIGDLLSIVMTKCEENNLWITSQTHMNIVSVADLNDVAGILIVGDVELEKSLIEKAEEFGVSLMTCEEEAYEIACRIGEVL
ncbi:MAG: DRTGG domain-containing protein [Bacillota bacterium]|nr:DRTGG domain-containing protein [Bacillota bacterium]